MYIFLYIFYKAYRNMLYTFYIAYRNNKSIKVYIFYNKKNLNLLQNFLANLFLVAEQSIAIWILA